MPVCSLQLGTPNPSGLRSKGIVFYDLEVAVGAVRHIQINIVNMKAPVILNQVFAPSSAFEITMYGSCSIRRDNCAGSPRRRHLHRIKNRLSLIIQRQGAHRQRQTTGTSSQGQADGMRRWPHHRPISRRHCQPHTMSRCKSMRQIIECDNDVSELTRYHRNRLVKT